MTRAAVMVLALLVQNVLMGVLSLVVARSERTTRALRLWGWGLLIYSAGLLITLITFLPIDLVKVVGNGMIAFTPIAMIGAVLVYTPYRLPRTWALGGFAFTVGAIFINHFQAKPLVLVDFFAPAFLANALFLFGAIALLKRPPADAKVAARILAASFFFAVAVWSVRVVLLLVSVGATNDRNRADLTISLFAIAQMTSTVCSTLAMMWIEVRMMEAQLFKQNELLAENVRLKDDVERISRHDLRTPLNSVVSLAQIIREDPTLAPRHERSLRLIEQAGYRVLNMANLTLDLFKMETGAYQFTPKTVDIQAVMERVLVDLGAVLRTSEVTCDLRCEGFQAARRPLVRGDELLAHSLLTNLVKNAAEASPKGGRVDVRIVNGEKVEVRIHNQGAIPKAIRGRFFEKYATRGKKGGTGLGAYSASLMAKAQGGRISVETSDDAGTTMIVEWIAEESQQLREASAAAAAAELPVSRKLLAGEFWPARKILITDDDPHNRMVLQLFLSQPRWTSEEAENGPLALQKFQATEFDFVFLDLDMPVMDGFEVVEQMRTIERSRSGRRTTIIAFSSHEDQAVSVRAIRAGFDLYLTKPVKRQRIVEIVLGGAPDAVVTVQADLRELIPEFVEGKKLDVRRAEEAIVAKDAARAARDFHRMRGSLSLYGFREAADLCAEMEDLVHAGDFGEVGTRLAILYEYLDRVEVRYKEREKAEA